MNTTEYAREVVREIERAVAAIAPEEAEQLVDLVLDARRVFIAGAGRSGFAVKAFAMRLMHLGFTSFVVGETATPSATAEDVILIGSGSGETASLVAIAEKAKKIGARVALITVVPDSRIGRLADALVRIQAPTRKPERRGRTASIQPMGTLFEQTMLVLLDSVVLRLTERMGVDADAMFARHANLE